MNLFNKICHLYKLGPIITSNTRNKYNVLVHRSSLHNHQHRHRILSSIHIVRSHISFRLLHNEIVAGKIEYFHRCHHGNRSDHCILHSAPHNCPRDIDVHCTAAVLPNNRKKANLICEKINFAVTTLSDQIELMFTVYPSNIWINILQGLQCQNAIECTQSIRFCEKCDWKIRGWLRSNFTNNGTIFRAAEPIALQIICW